MNIQFRANRTGKVRTVRIHATSEEVSALAASPTSPVGGARIMQWAQNVVRSVGLTPEPEQEYEPIVDMNRGVANRGFTVVVWVTEGRPERSEHTGRPHIVGVPLEDDASVSAEMPTEGGY